MVSKDKEYYAFISYKSEDVEWATWLQHELEHYHLPASFNGRTDVPQELRPVFRDIDELSAGNLPEQIKHALANSQNLIVICSPQAAESPWVNQEVEYFISLGRTDCIFPFIVEGNSPSEFFPPALRDLPKDEERLGGDVSKKGRDAAFIKVVAGMLGVGFDSLWNRYEKEKAEEERKQREQRDNLLRVQSRFIAEKANDLLEDGDSYTARLLALNALPDNLESPNRPYVPEAEAALRKAIVGTDAIILPQDIKLAKVAPNGQWYATVVQDGEINIRDIKSGGVIFKLRCHQDYITNLEISPDSRYIATASVDMSIVIWNADDGSCRGMLLTANAGIDYYENKLMSFSPDSKFLALLTKQFVMTWNINSRKLVRKFSHNIYEYSYKRIFFNKDATKISIITNKGIFSWSMKTGSKYAEKKFFPTNPAVSTDGEKILIIKKEIIEIWNSEPFSIYKTYNIPNVTESQFSIDGKLFSTWRKDAETQLWDIETGTLLYTLETGAIAPFITIFDYILWNTGASFFMKKWKQQPDFLMLKEGETYPQVVHFSDKSKRVISISHDIHNECGWLTIWNLTNSSQILRKKINGNCNSENRLCISHDGSVMAYYRDMTFADYGIEYEEGFVFGTIVVVNILEDTIIREFPVKDKNPDHLIISNDNHYIATTSWGVIYIWDLKNGKMVSIDTNSEETDHRNHITFWTTITFSPDIHYIIGKGMCFKGQRLVFADIKRRRYKDFTYKDLTLDSNIAFNPEGTLFAGCFTYGICIFNTKTLDVVQTIKSQSNGYLSFSIDGRLLMHSCYDGNVNVYDVDSGVLLYNYCYELMINARFSQSGEFIFNWINDSIFYIPYQPLANIISEQHQRFSNRQLSSEERKRYYIE